MDLRDIPERWPTVGSTEYFKGRILTVREDEVVMPGPHGPEVVKREYVTHPGAVGTIALDEQGRVLLLRQYRHACAHLLWELPAGLRDVEGEPLWRTAERELLEEAGYRAATWHTLIDTFQTPGMSDERVRVFLARDVTPVPAAEIDFVRVHEEADMPAVWVPLEEAVTAVLAGEVHNALAVSAVLALAAARARGFAGLRDRDAPTGEAAGDA
ncbi:NUDIX hydrolase [Actinocorallia sp. API 0066]|uniref:NUDIX domain-containing protein n=1 Tax=Actinocorallia sp. API 0066 TaxID=2896846 RepID=UPI001E5C0055|nr:NUDIX hydrolase [Actinocorallia sp. API 0066]MCD0450723.1 NUDIX hydrolase [Actinocorallia sp. API 0066]